MRALTGLLLFSSGFALETSPWMGTPLEFTFDTEFMYSHYRHVEGARVQPSGPVNDYELAFATGFTATTGWDVQGELEFVQTPEQNFSVRSGALQGRYQWLDDITGDAPVSFITGINFRGVTTHSLHDVSSPYASDFNAELTASLGKEWSEGAHWTSRTYGFLALGMANRSLPWMRGLYVWQNNWHHTHHLTLYTTADFGFGGQQHIDVHHFRGWGKVQHQSIDVGATYGYHMHIWGTLSVGYAYRVFAHNFPQSVNFVLFEYHLPFSPF